MSVEQNIISAIDTIFSHCRIEDEDKVILVTIAEEAQKLSPSSKQILVEHLLHSTLPNDNVVPMYFFLYDCFKDIRFLERVVDYLPSRLSLQMFYEVYLNISNRLFSSSVKSKKISTAIRNWYTDTSETLTRFLSSRGLTPNAYPLAHPKKIAILSQQLLNMRHSPTREAYSLALHLKTYHGCQCYVINTNAMSFNGVNSLGLIQPILFRSNEQLDGVQTIPVKYLHFNTSLNVVSFPTGPMTTQKVANIVDTLHQLGIEAVISHGDNLVVMEALYQTMPSLFATTGAVVPNNHCDAYFIPEHLFDDSAKKVAHSYGHDNFMMESMLVTPEGIAEQPASREDYGLFPEQFVYLIVGTRLQYELNREFIEVCKTLLCSDGHTRIIFAGTPELELLSFFDEQFIAEKRVQNIGFQNDLPAISRMCDCYLNPQRTGGGTSSQTAIINGLPIVTRDEGHISAIVPEQRRHASWDEYLTYAVELRENRKFLDSECEMFKQHFFSHLDAKGQVKRIYDMLCTISDNAQK
ncbi:MAG: hypothetical protein AXW14_06760 [Alteromonas sp. Nap_26]|nr:MAG: hypothetical protein AXW14_06760 [Alteromonas sp. Nap_26]